MAAAGASDVLLHSVSVQLLQNSVATSSNTVALLCAAAFSVHGIVLRTQMSTQSNTDILAGIHALRRYLRSPTSGSGLSASTFPVSANAALWSGAQTVAANITLAGAASAVFELGGLRVPAGFYVRSCSAMSLRSLHAR